MAHRYQTLTVRHYVSATSEEEATWKRDYKAMSHLMDYGGHRFKPNPQYEALANGTFQPPEGGRLVAVVSRYERYTPDDKTVFLVEFDDVAEGHPYRV